MEQLTVSNRVLDQLTVGNQALKVLDLLTVGNRAQNTRMPERLSKKRTGNGTVVDKNERIKLCCRKNVGSNCMEPALQYCSSMFVDAAPQIVVMQ